MPIWRNPGRSGGSGGIKHARNNHRQCAWMRPLGRIIFPWTPRFGVDRAINACTASRISGITDHILHLCGGVFDTRRRWTLGGFGNLRAGQLGDRMDGTATRRQFGERMDRNVKNWNSSPLAIIPAMVMVAATLGIPPDSAAQSFQSPLQSLPPIRALPITSSGSPAGLTLTAIGSPAYCDSQTLRQSATIRAIRFWDDRRGIAVGDYGHLLVTQDGGKTWTSSPSDVECRLNDASWIDARRVVVVGGGLDPVTRLSRGVVLTSNDAGQTWRRSADHEIPTLHTIVRDTGTVRSINRTPSLTAQGDPDPITGASTFLSNDGGRSWQSTEGNPAGLSSGSVHQAGSVAATSVSDSLHWSQTLGTRSVVRATCPVNQQTIICGGDHGNLFRSADGGQSWQTVHGENAACAILIIAGSADEIPWALAGRESLEKRHRTNLLVAANTTSPASNVSQAAMHVGIAAVDVYPSANPAAAVETLKRWIDIHRPPIVALDANISAEIRSTILQHAVTVGTNKVVEYSRADRGEMLFHDSAMLPGCGVLAGDFRDDCMTLVADSEMIATTNRKNSWIAIETRYGDGFQSTHGDSIGFGVRLKTGHRLPAQESKASRRRLQVVQGRLKQQNAIANLFDSNNSTRRSGNENKFAEAMRLLLDQTSRIDQFRSALEIARQAIGSQNQVAVWSEIAERFTGSSAAKLAELHANTRRNSSEWHLHQELAGTNGYDIARELDDSMHPMTGPTETFLPLTDASKELLPDPDGHAAIVSPFQSNETKNVQPPFGVVQASALLPIGRARTQNYLNRSRQATQNEVDLAWQMHPIRLIVGDAIARNERRHITPSQQDSQETADGPTVSPDPTAVTDPTVAAPRSEDVLSADLRRIAQRHTVWASLLKTQSPQTTIGIQTPSPPRLDGKLDEPFWNTSFTKPAHSRGECQVKHQFAWDNRFLYVAMQTPAKDFKQTANPTDAGTRDADLFDSDRVTIGFDVDRDLMTSMNLSFTRDGRTHDDIDGNARWNPTWYVASDQTGDHVTTEIAIELSSLGIELKPDESWFIRTQVISAEQPRRFEMMPDALNRVRVDFR